MKRTFYVMRNEIQTALGRRSYVLLTFGIPILSLVIFGAVTLFRNNTNSQEPASNDPAVSNEMQVEGYVDQAGLIQSLPEDLPEGKLIAFSNEVQARQALEAGDIDSFYIITEDYIDSGEIYYIVPEFAPFGINGQDWAIRWALTYNLTEQDLELASMIWMPMNAEPNDLSQHLAPDTEATGECTTAGYTCDSNPFIRMLPMFVLILFFVFISTSAGLLLRSVSTEKQNQTMETLLLSLDSQELLSGKVIGLGLLALFQMLLWFGTGFIIMKIGGGTLNLPPGFELPASLLVWAVILFIGGYAIYASLMAGLGALVPDIKASSQASFIVMFPLLIGYFLSILPPVQEAPHGLLATVLSIFPFSAPTVMMMRLTVGGVPTWQLILTAVLLFITAILVVRAVSKMFHAQTILSGQPFSPKRYINTLIGRG